VRTAASPAPDPNPDRRGGNPGAPKSAGATSTAPTSPLREGGNDPSPSPLHQGGIEGGDLRRDNVYSTIKDQTLAAGPPDKSGVRTLAPPPPPAPTDLVLVRSFVYGMDYIDEVVAHIMPDGKARWVLQDANYNVVGIARECDNTLIRQFRYQPYGDFEREGSNGAITGIEGFDSTGQVVSLTPAEAASPQGFQGLWYDAETGLYYIRARCYDPVLGRFVSRDPNEQALVLANVLHMNAQTPTAFASLSAMSQYSDGMNPYLGFGSNPVNALDPSGMIALDFDDDFGNGFDDPGGEQFFGNFGFDRTMDWMAEGEDLGNELDGTKLATLGAINEGARWASLGLQTTLDVAGGLLGIDVFQSVAVLASGQGGFWDSMNIVMAVAPIGSLGKAGGKLAKAFKQGRRAGKATKLAVSAARHLFKILPYNQATKLTKGYKHKIEAHHILEARHARSWGLDEGSIPAVILSQADHTRFNQLLRTKLPYATEYTKKDQQRVWAVYKEVYKDHPEWLRAVESYFR